jgi:acyl-CoA synthetase (AMP-forming)/AMP-acid ligase II
VIVLKKPLQFFARQLACKKFPGEFMPFDYAAHGLIPSAHRLPLPGVAVPHYFPPQHLGEILDHQLKKDGTRRALVGNSGSYSYAELDREVNKACAVYKQLGIQRYDRIAVCLPNDVDIIIAFLASARIGAIWVGVNRPLAGPEKAQLLQDSAAKIFLADPPYVKEIGKETSNCPALQKVIAVDRDNRNASEWHQMLAKETGDKNIMATDIDPFEPVAIAYTSGTTGSPKGCVHSHHNVMLPGAIAVANKSYGPDCAQGVMLPLTILNLMVLAPVTAFQDGSCCVCIDGLKPEIIAEWIRKEKVGHFASVPTVIHDLLTSTTIAPADLKTLGTPDIGGASCPDTVQQLYKERFGRGIIMAYGMTEAPTIVSRTDPNKKPVNDLCGKAVEQIELVVVDANDRPLPQGETGEICVKPAETGRFARVYTTMLGYWNKPDATQKALSSGMFHTGDEGYFDANGDLFIRGRRNELIIRGGANVYPAEVERIMMQHPSVAIAAVLGIPDERLGQRVVAAIEQKPGSRVDEKQIYEFCRERLARYKVPDTIKTVDALPRNAMNKIVKPKLVPLFG